MFKHKFCKNAQNYKRIAYYFKPARATALISQNFYFENLNFMIGF